MLRACACVCRDDHHDPGARALSQRGTVLFTVIKFSLVFITYQYELVRIGFWFYEYTAVTESSRTLKSTTLAPGASMPKARPKWEHSYEPPFPLWGFARQPAPFHARRSVSSAAFE